MNYMEEKQNNKLEEKVMGDIKGGKLKLRSRYIFLAEKLGVGSALTLSILLAVLFFSLALFYLKASDNLIYLSFGSLGFYAFLESFPYLLVVSLIVFIFIAGLIIKKSDLSYKKPFGYLAIGLIVFILAAGSVLAFTNIAEDIEQQSFGPGFGPVGFIFRPFLQNGLDERNGGIAGKVVEVDNGYIIIQTPRGLTKVDLSELETPLKEQLQAGSFIIAIGEKKGDVFEAHSLHVVNENDLPMIRRGVHRRFGLLPPVPGITGTAAFFTNGNPVNQ